MGPIFNKKVIKSVICGTVNSTYALFTVDKVIFCGLEKKKKKKKRKTWRRNVDVSFIANQTVTESSIPNAKSSIYRLEIPLLLLSKPKRTMKGATVIGQTCSSPWAKGAFSSIVVKF